MEMEKLRIEFMEVLAKNIRVERIRRDMSQEELADKANISRHFLCHIENAGKIARVDTYLKIATALNLQLFNLLCGDSLPTDHEVNCLLSGCSDLEKRVCINAIKGILTGIREV